MSISIYSNNIQLLVTGGSSIRIAMLTYNNILVEYTLTSVVHTLSSRYNLLSLLAFVKKADILFKRDKSTIMLYNSTGIEARHAP
jgi:hypothetical protein